MPATRARIAAADRRDRRAYYAGTTAGFEALSDLVRRTHTTTPRYLPLREVYPWVDLHPEQVGLDERHELVEPGVEVDFTAQPRPASIGVWSGPMSLPHAR